MYLLSVTLTNFKTHRDRNFEFQLGTNAICGVNGAGKTSILEAIAWTLFNYRGVYKQEDLVRNGSGSAQARVAFVSSYDGRTYEVERCTSRGYTIFDPQLGQRLNYSRIKDEVEPWLQQHLGVPAGTDLGQLFANTIGVPQGTFTADFLLSPEKRKPIFDSVLKVEEYRRVHKESNSLRRYAESQVDLLKTQLQQYDEQLQIWDSLKTRHMSIVQEIDASNQKLSTLQLTLTQLQTQKDALTLQVQRIQLLQQRQQQLFVQTEAKQQSRQVTQQSYERAQQAKELCQTHLQAYQTYLTAEKALAALNQQNKQRQVLLQQQQQQQRSVDQQSAKLSRLQLQLEQREQLQTEITNLLPDCKQQACLEAEYLTLQKQQQTATKIQLQIQSLQSELARLQAELQQVQQELTALNALHAITDTIPVLEQQQQRWQQQLSRIAAAQQFELELQRLVATHQSQSADYKQQVASALSALGELQHSLPLLSETVVQQLKAAIATGQTLNQTIVTALADILNDLAEQVDAERLKANLEAVQIKLTEAYGYRAQLTNRPKLEHKQVNLSTQQQQSQVEMTQLEQQLAEMDALNHRLRELERSIQQLGDPQGRYQVLQGQLQTMANVQSDYERLQAQRQTLTLALTQLTEQLSRLTNVDADISQQQQLRQEHQAGYLQYVQNEKDAQTLAQMTAELTSIDAVIQQLNQQQVNLKTQLAELTEGFDPEALQSMEQRYGDVKSECDRITGSLPQQRKLEVELANQLEGLTQLSEKRAQAQLELKQKERTKRFINFARRAYKEAGPRITERYVQGISQEADRLFRDLLNRPNVALEWTRDYEILVQEGGNTRRFVNLSGGEQMCAALAVRLALLKVLADIDVAFFDEPTTNMDRPRRESLAEAIARLKAFKQLFVISHDDTFEKVTENVIVVEREDE